MFVSEGSEGIHLISDGPIGTVLYVIGSRVALAPLLQDFGGEAEYLSRAIFVDDGIVVEGRDGRSFDVQIRGGQFFSLGGPVK